MNPGPRDEVRRDLDLRKLRYFVAVAEELHFGQAAERLYVAQPVLSRQIRRLEQEVGADLFTRSSRQVQLTPAGEQLLEEARHLLAAADAAARRVRRAADGAPGLTVGFFIGDPISRVVRAFRRERPEVDVAVVRIYWSDQSDVLFDGRADVVFAHLPIEEDGLTLVRLYSSPRLALLPATHRLAGAEEIELAELADDAVVMHRGATPAWEAWHNADPRPDGRRARPGPTVANIEEKLEVVGAGEAISFVPNSVASAVHMPVDVVAIPVVDLPPTEVYLAFKTARRSSMVDAFVDTARTVLAEAAPARH
jgi:DNA-binding transcriptional LysR family regulator